MRRRDLLQGLAATSLMAGAPFADAAEITPLRRVRPGDATWPTQSQWRNLDHLVGGALIRPSSLYGACGADPSGEACASILPELRNPFYISDQAGGTQVSGWLDAWQPAVSPYAVAARHTADVVAAINFARRHNLRVTVKGGGHSYQGTSNAPDSLLIWTHPMRRVLMHEHFVPAGGGYRGPAVTIEAGALWMDAYDVVTTQGGRYVQGGGCTTVGVAGHIQSGGFGSLSKRFGTAASNLLEAEIVCADGGVRLCSERRHPDLFWAIKGGGGGSFGVITRVTVKTHDLPENFGWAVGKVKASSDAAFQSLIAQFMRFYTESLFNPHWGEHVSINPDNTLELSIVSQGLSDAEAKAVWAPFLAWIAASPQDLSSADEILVGCRPARLWWDTEYRRTHGDSMHFDPRPGAPAHNAWWSGDGDQVSMFLYGYDSVWLSQSLLRGAGRDQLAQALFTASRAMDVGIHFNKGLAGAPADVLTDARNTAMNPDSLDAFGLAIVATGGPPPYLHIPGFPYDDRRARADAAAVARAAAAIRTVAPNGGSYVAESDYFNRNWREASWGSNYPRLARAKRKYDPNGLFIVHHGVGSEDWSPDGFSRSLVRL
ncbi:MAG: FAD-binding oxidoreductase [Proteobacteria bacterium]|nr:FAD-binding oxidoreductase [Pseudomonadota bacterium]